MTVGVPAGGFKIFFNEEGVPDASLELHVYFDVCPTWFELAIRHLKDAENRRDERTIAWTDNNEDLKASTLEREFESSMQAIMAAAIAIDAFYAAIRDKVALPDEQRQQWRENRTPRYAQIAEVIRQGFSLTPDNVRAVRGNIKEIFRLRDLAVHPRGQIEKPILHPELSVGVEWRFAYYRFHNAHIVVREALSMVWQLSRGRSASEDLTKYVQSLGSKLSPVVDEWEQCFGPLIEP